MSHPHNSSKRVHVYIDETGDRGRSSASSPIFGMAAVIIEQSDTSVLRQALLDLRKDFRVPNGKVLSWKEYVKTHDRRRQAARRLAAVQGIRVCYVYVDKRALRPTAYGGSVEVMYNYVAGKMLKSALWAARSAFGTDGQVWIRYGHVRRHNHQTTESYLRQQILPDPRVPSAMLAGLNWVLPTNTSKARPPTFLVDSSRRRCGPVGSSRWLSLLTFSRYGASFTTRTSAQCRLA